MLDGETRHPLRKLVVAHRRRGAPSRASETSSARASPVACRRAKARRSPASGPCPETRTQSHRNQRRLPSRWGRSHGSGCCAIVRSTSDTLERRTGQRANPALEQGFGLYRGRNRIGPMHPGRRGAAGSRPCQHPQRQARILRLETVRPVREPSPALRRPSAPSVRTSASSARSVRTSCPHAFERAENAGHLGRSQRALRLEPAQSMAHVDQRQGQRQVVHIGSAMQQGNLVITLDSGRPDTTRRRCPARSCRMAPAPAPAMHPWTKRPAPASPSGAIEGSRAATPAWSHGNTPSTKHLPRWFAAPGVEIAEADRREEFGVRAETACLCKPQRRAQKHELAASRPLHVHCPRRSGARARVEPRIPAAARASHPSGSPSSGGRTGRTGAIATRYGKLGRTFPAFVHIASMWIIMHP